MLTVIDEYSRFPFAIPAPDVSALSTITSLSQLFSLTGLPSYVHSDRGSAFVSKELREYLLEHGVATSRTSPYNPQGNGLTERYNGIIWKAVTLCLRSKNLPDSMWESVLPEALHSVHSLINISTGVSRHERFFNFQRKTSSGTSLPVWLTTPGPVLLRNFRRTSKYDPIVQQVDLIDANPQYAFIKYPDGRQSTVSLRDLAPLSSGELETDVSETSSSGGQIFSSDSAVEHQSDPQAAVPVVDVSDTADAVVGECNEQTLRRSGRVRRPPTRLDL